jgi:hypothetical protein
MTYQAFLLLRRQFKKPKAPSYKDFQSILHLHTKHSILVFWLIFYTLIKKRLNITQSWLILVLFSLLLYIRFHNFN